MTVSNEGGPDDGRVAFETGPFRVVVFCLLLCLFVVVGCFVFVFFLHFESFYGGPRDPFCFWRNVFRARSAPKKTVLLCRWKPGKTLYDSIKPEKNKRRNWRPIFVQRPELGIGPFSHVLLRTSYRCTLRSIYFASFFSFGSALGHRDLCFDRLGVISCFKKRIWWY